VKVEIIPVGTEILLGNIVDTNSSFLANQLSLLGIDLYFISTVGDNKERLVNTLRQAWTRADVLITTGGLGPTQGDISREAIAELVGEELKVDQKLWQELQSLLHRFPGKIPQVNVKQAQVIPSTQTIPNSMGTAPGWWVEKDGHIIIALPGPPDEMQLMWEESVLHRLQQMVTGATILSRTIKIFGLAEAAIDELLAPFLKLSNPTLATYIKPDGIHLRITAKASEKTKAEQMIAEKENSIRELLAPYIWGADNDTFESVIENLLEDKNLTLAVMESCTGGLLSNTVATCLESSTRFKGGWVACSDEAKTAFGIQPYIIERYGTESSEVAEAMAEVAHKNLAADIGIGIAGSIYADRRTAEVFIGLNGNKFKRVITRTYLGNRLRIKQRAVYSALFELKRTLLEEV